MNGYHDKLLVVDLTNRIARTEKLNREYARKFIGGSGLACRIIYGMVNENTDPLGPENPLVFMTGPLTGTKAPSCGRHVVCALSPLTGIWGESNSGGSWGAELRFAGFDGIVIKGKANHLVYLLVVDGNCEIRDATHLRGKDTYETQEIIKEEGGDKKIKVACIGLGGENLVKYAAIMNDNGRAAGRCGLGAVMGSKNLKGIGVRGDMKIPLADEEKFNEVAKDAFKFVKESFISVMLSSLGTSGYVDMAQEMGDMPNKYYTQGYFERAAKLSGATMASTILTGNERCYLCPIGCGRKIEIKEGKYKLSETQGPEYETVATFGSLLLNDNLEGVAYANYLCNVYGLDTISCGVTIAFAYYLYDKGIISTKDTNGLRLEWGDIDTAIELVKMIAMREKFGDILAEGTKSVGRKYNAEEFAVEVNGLEVPMHDPRAFTGMAICYATSPRGACHLQGDTYSVNNGVISIPELEIDSTDRFATEGEAKCIARVQNLRALYNSMIMCQFAVPTVQHIADMLTYATGEDIRIENLNDIGERIFDLKRAFNNRLGLGRSNDRLPKLLLMPLATGGTASHLPDMEKQLREYYEYRKWDWNTGKPTKEKLISTGLDDIAEDLWVEK